MLKNVIVIFVPWYRKVTCIKTKPDFDKTGINDASEIILKSYPVVALHNLLQTNATLKCVPTIKN